MAVTATESWAYAVPLDETNGLLQPKPADTRRFPELGYAYEHGEGGELAGKTGEGAVYADSERLQARRPSVKSNRVATRKRSRAAFEQRSEPAQEVVDDSPWIHRDKLAQIEIQEMEEAGIHVRRSRGSTSAGPGASARSSRSVSHAGAQRGPAKERLDGVEDVSRSLSQTGDGLEKRRGSNMSAEDAGRRVLHQAFPATEETSGEQQRHYHHKGRPSTSKIPVPKSSIVPVPQTVVERDSPLLRSGKDTGGWSGSWDERQYTARARSNSAGSQGHLDDTSAARSSSRPTSSQVLIPASENVLPQGNIKVGPTSTARKVSAPASGRPTSSQQSKPRVSSLTKRPGSSAGHKPRPSTGHTRPEGEAPWIASMYKPDPRLPPDQQMLPTHAKRMMQEQWERDGETGTAYDRDLRLLNNDDFSTRPRSNPHAAISERPPDPVPLPKDPDAPDKDLTLPPRPPTPQGNGGGGGKASGSTTRLGTSGGGGYRITPTITPPPVVQRSVSKTPSSSNTTGKGFAAHNQTPRVPDFGEEKMDSRARKGCCCVVM